MNPHPTPGEKLVHRIEEHVEEWRKQEAARQAGVEAERDQLWAEAAEREKRLAEAVIQKDKHSIEEATKRHKIAFVVHAEEAGEALEALAGEKARLVEVVSGHRDYKGIPGFKGSWLIFEDAGEPAEDVFP